MAVGLAQCIHILSNLLGRIPGELTIHTIPKSASSNCWMIPEFFALSFSEKGTEMGWSISMSQTCMACHIYYLRNPAWSHHPSTHNGETEAQKDCVTHPESRSAVEPVFKSGFFIFRTCLLSILSHLEARFRVIFLYLEKAGISIGG